MKNILVEHIEATPGVVGGKARIAGHRIRVMDIVLLHEKRGLAPDEILALYPSITLADIYAALAYYFDHRQEIEAELKDESERAASLKGDYPSKLQAKLHG